MKRPGSGVDVRKLAWKMLGAAPRSGGGRPMPRVFEFLATQRREH